MKIEKILLIAPPAFTMRAWRDINPLPPMGLGYLASVAEKSGINVKIVDCLMQGWDHEEDEDEHLLRVGLPDERIREIIREFKPDMVGINCQFSRQYRIYHQMFALVKGVDPQIVVVAGGPHASVCPKRFWAMPTAIIFWWARLKSRSGNFTRPCRRRVVLKALMAWGGRPTANCGLIPS